MILQDSANKFLAAAASGLPIDRGTGISLAANLRSRSIDLQYSKATEFSPDVQELALLAAQVALVSFGAHSGDLAEYEKDVFYYRCFSPPHPIVSRYESFKSHWVAHAGGA